MKKPKIVLKLLRAELRNADLQVQNVALNALVQKQDKAIRELAKKFAYDAKYRPMGGWSWERDDRESNHGDD